tara:strand:+ start:423 stop:725 length:303 start_codon:yes stop_codon:yes gene_type:complete
VEVEEELVLVEVEEAKGVVVPQEVRVAMVMQIFMFCLLSLPTQVCPEDKEEVEEVVEVLILLQVVLGVTVPRVFLLLNRVKVTVLVEQEPMELLELVQIV